MNEGSFLKEQFCDTGLLELPWLQLEFTATCIGSDEGGNMYCICLHCSGNNVLFRRKYFILKDPSYTFCFLRLELLVILKDITDFHLVISLISEEKYSQIGQTYPPHSTTYFGWGNSFYIPLVGNILTRESHTTWPDDQPGFWLAVVNKMEHVTSSSLSLILKATEQYRFFRAVLLQLKCNGTYTAVLLGQKTIIVLIWGWNHTNKC